MFNYTSGLSRIYSTGQIQLFASSLSLVSELGADNQATILMSGDTVTLGTNLFVTSNVSASSFTDRTPSYTGKSAVAELKLVKNDKNGNIDHSTLPAFARKKITSKDKKGKESEADGRDIGAMISILTKAVQELDERIEKIENRTK